MESDELDSVSNFQIYLQSGFCFSFQEWAEKSALIFSKLKKNYFISEVVTLVIDVHQALWSFLLPVRDVN